jgi:hypothetical protein
MTEFFESDYVCGRETSTKSLDDIYNGVRLALLKLPKEDYPKEWSHFRVEEYAVFLDERQRLFEEELHKLELES